ncbi:MAG: hypothetical protein IT167_29480 [Bryobacterales bacterium]|nr:hypothetical protein [Bryobacterales bacterium]
MFPFFLRDGFDYPDFLYAFLGKPFLMLTAIRDFFPIGGARSTFAEAKEVFGRLGLASQVAMFEADDGHGYSKPRREAAYRWFTRWLQGKENDSPEAPLTLASEEELQCAPTGQVKTSIPDATDVFTLNLETARRLRAGRTSSPETIRARAREVTAYEAHAGPLQITSYGLLTRPACRAEKLTLQSEPGILLPALLFLPEDGPDKKPAILLADGKGKAAAASDAESLAGKGYIVLAPDLRGFGETEPALDRRDYFVHNFGDYESTWNALLTGKTMLGMRAGDVTRGIDLLAARKDVDSARVFVIGRGAAATAALFAALFDGRIRSLLVEKMLSSYESVVTERILQGNVDQMTPSALRYFDLPAIAAALAPRRVGVFNALNPLGQELPLSRLRKEYAGLPATVEIGVRPREQPLVAFAERFLR